MRKNKPLISVIVPIYNTDTYLEECLDSVIKQAYENLEIILIDDGSTDTCPQICDRYAEQDDRIVVVHQENRGLVASRKVGVNKARGEYVGFVDSDDWIEPQTYSSLINANEIDADIISFGYRCVHPKWEYDIVNEFTEGIYKGKGVKELYSKMMYDKETRQSGITRSLCSKLIKRYLLRESMVELDEKITLGEDAAVVYKCCLKANTIMIVNKAFYKYRVHEKSMCRTSEEELFSRVFWFYEYMKKVFLKYDEKYGLVKQLNWYTFEFLENGLVKNFNMVLEPVTKMPPIANVKIILYGAGVCGKEYYECIQEDENFNLVSWVDKKCFNQLIQGYLIEEPSIGIKKEYDKIIIAVKSESVAEEIRSELVQMGVKQENIIWDSLKYFNRDIRKIGWR